MKVLDSHFHLWQLSQVPQPWIDPTAMSAINRDFDAQDYTMALNSAVAQTSETAGHIPVGSTADNPLEFGGGVLVQTITHDLETDIYLQAAADSSKILGVVGWVDLNRPDLDLEIQRLKALPGGAKLVGIRHQIQDEPGNGSLDSAQFFAGLERLVAHELTFDLILRADQISAAAQLAEQLPDLMFVLDHVGKPNISTRESDPLTWDTWERALSELAEQPNTVVKWSGLSTEAHWEAWTHNDLTPAWEHLNGTFGPQRIMWGSDWPVVEISGGPNKWARSSADFASELTQAEQRAFWGETAQSVYGLQRGPAHHDSNQLINAEHE